MNFDVIGINLTTHLVRILVSDIPDARNADAYVSMAIDLRGLDEEFYSAVPAGHYHTGDKYLGVSEGGINR